MSAFWTSPYQSFQWHRFARSSSLNGTPFQLSSPRPREVGYHTSRTWLRGSEACFKVNCPSKKWWETCENSSPEILENQTLDWWYLGIMAGWKTPSVKQCWMSKSSTNGEVSSKVCQRKPSCNICVFQWWLDRLGDRFSFHCPNSPGSKWHQHHQPELEWDLASCKGIWLVMQ